MNNQTKTYRRVNITLPSQTLRLIERVAEKGERSRLIDEAIRFYVQKIGKSTLRKQLREGAIKRAKRDLSLAQEWFFVEHEAWQRSRR
ncbi:MAG: hypothetical protein DDT19_02956 [Syntrophomonadaceae bacterium]|nr:hypothetical protein [Bacillota bacterium]